MKYSLKNTLGLMGVMVMSFGCTTIYYPNYEFLNRVYQPVKKGDLKLSVHSRYVFRASPNDDLTYRAAYHKGRKQVDYSIQQFCGSGFDIVGIESKKERVGTVTQSYVPGQTIDIRKKKSKSSYLGYYKPKTRIKERIKIDIPSQFAQESEEYQYDHYEKISFQCKK